MTRDMNLTHKINFEAWSRTLIGFIRHKGLEQELKDWSGGWPCPIGSDPEAPLAKAAEALEQCQKALAMIIEPGDIAQTTVLHAFAAAKEAECRARTALSTIRSEK